jgi:hypothetical protein
MKGSLKFSTLLTALLFCSLMEGHAGLKWAEVGINGLTCSMCSRSVEMSIRRLGFVDSVSMSLEATEGRIFFKPNEPVDLYQLAKAVVNAGFSVRFIKLQWDFSDIPLSGDGSFVFHGQPFKWLDVPAKVNKPVTLQLVDENFLPKKESTEWKKKLTSKDATANRNVLHVVQRG